MKKILFLFSFLVLLSPVIVLAQVDSTSGFEQIDNYKTEITIQKDSSFDIKETIDYDFGDTEHHGIYRDIPMRYKISRGNVKIDLNNVIITDSSGKALDFTTSRTGGNIRYKIGDPNKTITGKHIYVISYTVNRAINYFADHDELYWNAIGTEWPVSINKGQAIINIPDNITLTENQSTCFTGILGSEENNCTVAIEAGKITINTTGVLSPISGLTVVVSLPKGLVVEPTAWQKFIHTLFDNWILVLPLIVFGIMFLLWRKYGKDPKGTGTIVAQYEAPDNLTPLELGTLVDGSVDRKDISAEIIYLATLGYIKIALIETTKFMVFKGKDYELTKLKEPDDKILPIDKEILESFFDGRTSIKLSELKTDREFYKKFNTATNKTYKDLITKGYFPRNPKLMKGGFLVLGIIVAFLGTSFLGTIFGGLGAVASIVSGLIIIVFSFIMSSRTKKGVLAREHILGLKVYLNVAEKDRINFHNAPEKKPEIFEKLLPFAMALGVEKAWAEQFKDIYNQQPDWYSSSNHTAFNAVFLTSSLGDFSTSVRSVMTSGSSAASGSSGFGGGAGGGFGGGGGGSW